MLRDVWLRMPTIDKLSNQLDSLCSRMDTMELKVKDLESQNKDLEEGVGHIETELQGIRKVLDTKASSMELKKVNEQIVDLVNRSKRNNIVIHNIPEGAEGDTPDCCGLVLYTASSGTSSESWPVWRLREHTEPRWLDPPPNSTTPKESLDRSMLDSFVIGIASLY